MAVHREAIDSLRAVAQTTTNAAVKVGAAKGAAAASGALIELLAGAGFVPPSAFVWRSELQWRTAWSVLFAMLADHGLNEPSFTDELERRLAHSTATDVRLVELGPDPAPPLEAAA